MLELPDTIWIARREYERLDGVELVESILTYELLAAEYLDYGYEVTKYVRALESEDDPRYNGQEDQKSSEVISKPLLDPSEIGEAGNITEANDS